MHMPAIDALGGDLSLDQRQPRLALDKTSAVVAQQHPNALGLDGGTQLVEYARFHGPILHHITGG